MRRPTACRFLFGVVLLAIGACARRSGNEGAGETLVLLDQPAHVMHAGAVRGSTVSQEWKIKNVSGRMLIIDNVIPSCSCLAAEVSPVRLGPGQVGVVRAEISVDADFGATGRLMLTESRNPGKLLLDLRITARTDQRTMVTIVPRNVRLRRGDDLSGRIVVQSLYVKEDREKATLNRIAVEAPDWVSWSIDVKEPVGQADDMILQTAVVSLGIRPGFSGELEGDVVLQAGKAFPPDSVVSITARAPGLVWAEPEMLYLSKGEAPCEKKLVVRGDVELVKSIQASTGLAIEWTRSRDAIQLMVSVQKAGAIDGEVWVDYEKGKLSIPITGL